VTRLYVAGYREGDDLEIELLHVGDDPDVARQVRDMHVAEFDRVEIKGYPPGQDDSPSARSSRPSEDA